MSIINIAFRLIPILPVDPDDPKCKEAVDRLIKLYSSEQG